jgi:hypothetical protein
LLAVRERIVVLWGDNLLLPTSISLFKKLHAVMAVLAENGVKLQQILDCFNVISKPWMAESLFSCRSSKRILSQGVHDQVLARVREVAKQVGNVT